jgi:hypothetical protein
MSVRAEFTNVIQVTYPLPCLPPYLCRVGASRVVPVRGARVKTRDTLGLTGSVVAQVVTAPKAIELHHVPNRMTTVTPDALVLVRRPARVERQQRNETRESDGHIWFVRAGSRLIGSRSHG